MKVVVIGAVGSTKIVLERLISSDMEVAMVFSLDEAVSKNVSSYYPIHEIASAAGIPYRKFVKINEEEHVELIESIKPDYIFAVGFSQLICERIISAARYGTIGFHPTPLPKGRGRAAMVWQVLLGIRESACTMFFIDKGMDSGDIIAQEPYTIGENDYASDVGKSLKQAMVPLVDKTIEKLTHYPVEVVKQNESEATYFLKRSPEDGQIDWNKPIEEIYRLIRAVSHPYPGAFGMYDGKHKILIWRAEMLPNDKYFGINGQIAEKFDSEITILCPDGLLRVTDFENVDNVKLLVGHKLK